MYVLPYFWESPFKIVQSKYWRLTSSQIFWSVLKVQGGQQKILRYSEKDLIWGVDCKNFSVKFGYSEKATKFEENIPLKIWRYPVTSNFRWKIFSNFVAFSEYPNFTYREGGSFYNWHKPGTSLLYVKISFCMRPFKCFHMLAIILYSYPEEKSCPAKNWHFDKFSLIIKIWFRLNAFTVLIGRHARITFRITRIYGRLWQNNFRISRMLKS